MAVTVTEGNADEAREWVKTSSLTDTDKKALLTFLSRFPELTFYKQTLGGNPPEWLIEQCGIMAGFERRIIKWVQFDAFDHTAEHMDLTNTWYRLTMQATVDSAHPKVYEGETLIYFVGCDMEQYKTMLAIRFDKDDSKVYEFDYKSVRPNQVDLEDDYEDYEFPNDGFGHLEPGASAAVFDSYCSLFGHISAIRLADGREFRA